MYLDLQTMSTLFESGSKRLGFNFPQCPQVSQTRGQLKTTLYDDENDNDNDDEGGKGWFVSGSRYVS